MDKYVTHEEFDQAISGIKTALEYAIINGTTGSEIALSLAICAASKDKTVVANLEQHFEGLLVAGLNSPGWNDAQIRSLREHYSALLALVRKASKLP